MTLNQEKRLVRRGLYDVFLRILHKYIVHLVIHVLVEII
jgi:hypothetical protein